MVKNISGWWCLTEKYHCLITLTRSLKALCRAVKQKSHISFGAKSCETLWDFLNQTCLNRCDISLTRCLSQTFYICLSKLANLIWCQVSQDFVRFPYTDLLNHMWHLLNQMSKQDFSHLFKAKIPSQEAQGLYAELFSFFVYFKCCSNF